MTCEQPELDILAYLTDELDASEMAKVQAHLERCPACASEAAELRPVAQHLSTRLKQIPPLAVPPLVSARIARALQAERKQAKQRPFWPGLTVAVTAAAAFFVSLGFNPQLAEQVEQVPVVGVVAAPFLQADYAVQLATMPPSAAGSVGGAQRREPNVAVTANGVKVVVTRLEQRANQTTIWYRAEGAKLLPGADLKAYQPVITARSGDIEPVKLYRLSADQRGEDVLFTATFEAVPNVAAIELKALPLEGLPSQQQMQPWVIPFQ